MTEPSIVFYDIPSNFPTNCWSPNLWKARYALNFKGLSYKTVWVEYPDIEPQCKKIGADPTSTKADGRPHYTLPVIQDLSTGVVISDSTRIAQYLDATYPNKPLLMPAGTAGFHLAFQEAAHALISPIYPYGLPASQLKMNPSSAEYFRRTREISWGKTMEDLTPKGDLDIAEWKKLKDGFTKIDEWFQAGGKENLYFMGEKPCYADLWMTSYAMWISLSLPEKWEDMKTWNGGKWAKLLKSLEQYATVV